MWRLMFVVGLSDNGGDDRSGINDWTVVFVIWLVENEKHNGFMYGVKRLSVWS